MFAQHVSVTVYGIDAANRVGTTALSGVGHVVIRVVTPPFAMKDSKASQWEYEVRGTVQGDDWSKFVGVLNHCVVRDNIVGLSTHIVSEGVRKVG